MNKKDKQLQKHLVDEMMKVYETNPDVMLYMQALMENYEKLEQENKQLKDKIKNYKQENKELKANKNLNHVQKKEFEKLIFTNNRLIHSDEILTELEEYLQNHIEEWENDEDEYMNGVVAEDKDILHFIQELKEEYK